MLTFRANLSWMFKEHEFLDRFAAAAMQVLNGWNIFFLRPPIRDIAAPPGAPQAQAGAVQCPAGDLSKNGTRLCCLPARRADFRSSLAIALVYARATGAPRLHLMAGVVEGSRDTALTTYKDSLNYACDAAGDLDILIETVESGRRARLSAE